MAQLEIQESAAAEVTREAWLLAAIEAMRPLFADLEKQVPYRVQVSTGWAKKPGKGIGWCYAGEVTDGQATPIFVSPELDPDKPVDILGVVLHEMVHAADNCQSKHKGWFARTVKALGLEGKPTSTVVPETGELRTKLEELAFKLGPYPHVRLNLATAGIKRDTNRQLKIECSSRCGYKLRGSRKVLELGLPNCPVCDVEMEESV